MSLPLIIRPEAEQDMAEAREWYERHRDGLGDEFLQAVEDLLNYISSFPESFAEEYRSVRRARVRRFPYVVYYRTLSQCAEVLAVLHGSRHPRTWQSRA